MFQPGLSYIACPTVSHCGEAERSGLAISRTTSGELKAKLWNATVSTCPQASFRPPCSLALPALNSVFETARARAGAAEKHPPQIIYVVLFALGLGGSLLAGFSMAAAKSLSRVHMLTFAGALTITLYLITDIEYPRLGLITIDSFDHFLSDVRDQMG